MSLKQYIRHILRDGLVEFVEVAEEFDDGDLEEGVARTRDLVLGVLGGDYGFVDAGDLGEQFGDFGGLGLVGHEDGLEEGDGAEQDAVLLVQQAGLDFWEEFGDELWGSPDNLGGSQNCLLPDIRIAIADNLHIAHPLP